MDTRLTEADLKIIRRGMIDIIVAHVEVLDLSEQEALFGSNANPGAGADPRQKTLELLRDLKEALGSAATPTVSGPSKEIIGKIRNLFHLTTDSEDDSETPASLLSEQGCLSYTNWPGCLLDQLWLKRPEDIIPSLVRTYEKFPSYEAYEILDNVAQKFQSIGIGLITTGDLENGKMLIEFSRNLSITSARCEVMISQAYTTSARSTGTEFISSPAPGAGSAFTRTAASIPKLHSPHLAASLLGRTPVSTGNAGVGTVPAK